MPGVNSNLIKKIVDEQFKMVGATLRWNTLPKDGLILVGKKKKEWWTIWKFKDENEWIEWRTWAEFQLLDEDIENIESEMDYIDLRWGMSYNIKKGGQLEF